MASPCAVRGRLRPPGVHPGCPGPAVRPVARPVAPGRTRWVPGVTPAALRPGDTVEGEARPGSARGGAPQGSSSMRRRRPIRHLVGRPAPPLPRRGAGRGRRAAGRLPAGPDPHGRRLRGAGRPPVRRRRGGAAAASAVARLPRPRRIGPRPGRVALQRARRGRRRAGGAARRGRGGGRLRRHVARRPDHHGAVDGPAGDDPRRRAQRHRPGAGTRRARPHPGLRRPPPGADGLGRRGPHGEEATPPRSSPASTTTAGCISPAPPTRSATGCCRAATTRR